MHVTKKLLRNLYALIYAAITAYIIGAVISSIFVLKALPAKIQFGTYVSTALSDITNLKLYLVIILIGFSIAFPIAAALRKALPKLAKIGYPLAGAAAIGAALGLMYLQFETVPISGANNAFGFIMQLVTGALGGAIFANLQTPLN